MCTANTSPQWPEEERVVAVIPQNGATVKTTQEVELSQSASEYELEAQAFVINSDEAYERAGEFGRTLKQATAEITAFFKPMKETAHKAHKEICDREKAMLSPLQKAEVTIKRIMGDYALQKERERQAAEDEARRLAQEEFDRKLAEALAQEEAGNAQAAQVALTEAHVADNMSRTITVVTAVPKAQGVSTSKDWEVISIDTTAVPVNFNGVELRPVDEKAVIRLIRASKGQIQIPGVTYTETIKTSIRK